MTKNDTSVMRKKSIFLCIALAALFALTFVNGSLQNISLSGKGVTYINFYSFLLNSGPGQFTPVFAGGCIGVALLLALLSCIWPRRAFRATCATLLWWG